MALQSEATEILFGGAAGPGKSHLMRVAAIMWCAKIAGLQVYLFRRISEDLVKNHIEGPKGFRSMLAPWVIAGLVIMVEDEIRFWNGSKIYLCHCKDEKDRFKYLGAEIHVLLIDELTSFTEVIYRFLRGRVRAVGLSLPPPLKRLFPRILCASNPGNVGHLWVKRTFIDGAQPYEVRQMSDEEGGMFRQFIPALLADNPSMTDDDPTYRIRLRGLGSSALVKAMEGGDWNVVAGAYFDCWRTQFHVIEPFAIPKHWTRFGSFDWGSAKPFSYGLWAISDGSILTNGRHYPAGAMVRYAELYGASAPNVGLRWTTEKVAAEIKKLEASGAPNYRVADPAVFKQDGGPSHGETFHNNGVTFRPADNSRVTGWGQMRDRLLGDDETPMIYAFNTCHDSIRTIPALQHDATKAEDVDSDGEDHAGDDWRYACMSRPYTRSLPKPAPPVDTTPPTLNDLWKHKSQQKARRL